MVYSYVFKAQQLKGKRIQVDLMLQTVLSKCHINLKHLPKPWRQMFGANGADIASDYNLSFMLASYIYCEYHFSFLNSKPMHIITFSKFLFYFLSLTLNCNWEHWNCSLFYFVIL